MLTVGVAVSLALLIVVLATRPSADEQMADSPLIGKPAPPLRGMTIDSERSTSLRGGVLVNFFATWCVPWRQEHPELVRFSERHRVMGDAEVVGVIFDDSGEAVRAFRRREGGDWPMLPDPDGRVTVDFGVAGVPESFLIAPTGFVVAKLVGGVRQEDLERLLQQGSEVQP